MTTPGPDVLELNVAITNVEPTGGKKNAAVQGAAPAATVGVAPRRQLVGSQAQCWKGSASKGKCSIQPPASGLWRS